MTRLSQRPVLLGVLAALPLFVAVVALAFRPWVPVLDMVMTEFRVRDVGGRHTPLVGLPGRIGDFPDQGSHPGPWSFFLVAPWYRIAGSTAWGMELASAVINGACVVALALMGHRRLGRTGAVVFAVIGAVAVRGYGLTVLTHPWNPYFPVLLWLVALVATWSVLDGDAWFAPLATAASVVAAQTHVPYLVSAIALNVLVVTALVVRRRRSERTRPGRWRDPLWATLATATVLWLPPVFEQLRHGADGNIARLVEHFTTDQAESVIGLSAAARLVSQHFDAFAVAWDLIVRDDAFVHRAGQIDSGWSLGGLMVMIAWSVSIVWAWLQRHRGLLTLHAVTCAMTVVGIVSISRIFGKVWFYLTLWMSGTVLLVLLAIGWTVGILAQRHRLRLSPVAAGAVVGLVVTTLSVVAAIRIEVPEDELADDVRQIVPTVVAALEDHVGRTTGREGTYVVFWQESVVPGAQGYALMNELERRGYRVGVHPTWRVPATSHRVLFDGQYTAEIHLVSGAWIDEWQGRPDHLEVIRFDGRDQAATERFDELRARVESRLVEVGRPELIEESRYNLFGTSLRPDLPRDVVDDLSEMLLIGEPVAVFVAPPGSTF